MTPRYFSKDCETIPRTENKRKSITHDIPQKVRKLSSTMAPKPCLKRGQSSCNNSKTSPKKSVQFSDSSYLYDTLHRREFTDEERMACYYTVADLARIRVDINKTLRVMRTGQLPNTELCYFRGLETELVKPKKERLERVDLAIFAVQEHQSDRKEDGKVGLDEDWVNDIYRKITHRSIESAEKAACYDEFQAKQVCVDQVRRTVAEPTLKTPSANRVARTLKRRMRR